MNIRTSRFMCLTRSVLRRLGLTRILHRIIYGTAYEDKFHKRMMSSIITGDIVWDIGANVGLYSKLFSGAVGQCGSVIAFEPPRSNVINLNKAIEFCVNSKVMPFALGDRDSKMLYLQGADLLGATGSLTDETCLPTDDVYEVSVFSADSVVNNYNIPSPHVIKIDVEGYELEVLRGMKNILKNNLLRMICVEIHFGALEKRGLHDGPSEIINILQSNCFEIQWPDHSHIIATRAHA